YWIYETLAELSRETGKAEPMVNIICTYSRKQWALYLFPRSRHRPASFFAEGDAQLLVSPGAIDMAGGIVVPHRRHLHQKRAGDIATIYADVSMRNETVDSIVEQICSFSEPGDFE